MAALCFCEKRRSLLHFVGIGLVAILNSESALAVTLKEACYESLNHSNFLKASKQIVLSAQSRVQALSSERWPSINLTSDIGYTSQGPTSEGTAFGGWNNSLGLEFAWNVWDGGRRSTDDLIEKLALTKSEQEAVLSSNKTILKTAEAYLGLHKALLAKRNQSEKLRLLQKQKQNIEEKVKNGLAAESGLMEIEGRIQQSQATAIALDRRLKSSQSELANAMGTDTINGIKISDINELTIPVLKPPQKMKWDDTLAAKILLLDEQSDRLKLRQLDEKHGPQIDFTTNFNTGVRDVGIVGDAKHGEVFSRSSVALALKYNIFDAGQRRHEKSATLSKQQAQEFEREQNRREQRTALEELYQDLTSFSAQSAADRKLLDMEKKRFEIVEREYRRGSQSYLDLVAALDALSLAQQAVDDDLISEQLGLVRLHDMAGSIYAAIME